MDTKSGVKVIQALIKEGHVETPQISELHTQCDKDYEYLKALSKELGKGFSTRSVRDVLINNLRKRGVDPWNCLGR